MLSALRRSIGCVKRRETREVAGVEQQQCFRCKTWKPLTEFSIDRFKANGHCGFCLICNRKRSTAWRLANPERYKIRQREYNQRLRREALEAYGGAVCSCCGETTFEFLGLDHINGRSRAELAAGRPRGAHYVKWLKTNGYPSGLRVLCHNCNLGRWINGGTCPHEASLELTAVA